MARRIKESKVIELVARPVLGIHSSEDPLDLDPNVGTDCLNAEFRYGEMRTRPGYNQFGSTLAGGNDVLSLFLYEQSDGDEFFMALCTNKVYFYDTAGPDWSDITAALVPVATQAEPWSHDVMNDLLIMASYGSDIYKWAGAGNIAKLGGADGAYKAKIVRQYYDHLLLFNTSEVVDGACPFRCRWSDVGDPETWAGGASGTDELVAQDDVGPIFNAEMLGDFLYVFKKHSIFRCEVTESATQAFVFRPIVKTRGVIAQRTLKRCDDVLLFLTEFGVYEFGRTGETSIRRISQPIEADALARISRAFVDRSFAVVDSEEQTYTVFVPTEGSQEPSEGWQYCWATGAWNRTEYTATALCGAFWERQTVLTIDELVGTIDGLVGRIDDLGKSGARQQFIGDTTGKVFLIEPAQHKDEAAGYASWYTTKDFRLHGASRKSVFSEIDVIARGVGSMLVDYSLDGGASWTNLGSVTLGTWAKEVFYIHKNARQMRFRFRTDAAADSFMRIREYHIRGTKGARW